MVPPLEPSLHGYGVEYSGGIGFEDSHICDTTVAGNRGLHYDPAFDSRFDRRRRVLGWHSLQRTKTVRGRPSLLDLRLRWRRTRARQSRQQGDRDQRNRSTQVSYSPRPSCRVTDTPITCGARLRRSFESMRFDARLRKPRPHRSFESKPCARRTLVRDSAEDPSGSGDC